jgi:hypothetical protein
MEINWRAVGYGFLATVIIGLLSGFTIPFTNVTLPVVGYGLAGLIGGFVAGYMATTSIGSGMVHGGIATVIGGFVVLVILSLLAVFVSPVTGLGLLAAGLLVLFLNAIPGAVGGAIGSFVKGRREPTEMGRPAA